MGLGSLADLGGWWAKRLNDLHLKNLLDLTETGEQS